MRLCRTLALLPLALGTHLWAESPAPSPLAKEVSTALMALYPELDALYQDLHCHPELSGAETRTAAILATQLRKLGFEVTTGVGGTGVVGVLRNGTGPTVMLRTELDALPVLEKTGLPYASIMPGVMHACGHDLHMAAWTGAATLLATLKNRWHGTVVMVGQPAEETVAGARALVADGLFTRFPKPHAILAVHDRSDLPVGRVTWVAGYTMANVDTVDITVFGRGSHGARPELSVDPIVLAAKLVLSLQTIISREKDPLEPAVLTVGSIHGGTRPNIIPDEVHLQLTLRSYGPVVRQQLIDAIRRMAKAEALAAGAPKEPLIALSEGQEACWNDPALTRKLAARLTRDLGAAQVTEGRPDMVAEDFGELGKALGVPSVLLRTGTVSAATFKVAQAANTPLPSLHSSAFAPDREGGIQTAVQALVLSALDVLESTGVPR